MAMLGATAAVAFTGDFGGHDTWLAQPPPGQSLFAQHVSPAFEPTFACFLTLIHSRCLSRRLRRHSALNSNCTLLHIGYSGMYICAFDNPLLQRTRYDPATNGR